jgi:hypothetical protein
LVPDLAPPKRRGREPAREKTIRAAVEQWRVGYDPVARRPHSALRLYALLPTRLERNGVTLAEYAAEVEE